jgi:hypothetical protein
MLDNVPRIDLPVVVSEIEAIVYSMGVLWFVSITFFLMKSWDLPIVVSWWSLDKWSESVLVSSLD